MGIRQRWLALLQKSKGSGRHLSQVSLPNPQGHLNAKPRHPMLRTAEVLPARISRTIRSISLPDILIRRKWDASQEPPRIVDPCNCSTTLCRTWASRMKDQTATKQPGWMRVIEPIEAERESLITTRTRNVDDIDRVHLMRPGCHNIDGRTSARMRPSTRRRIVRSRQATNPTMESNDGGASPLTMRVLRVGVAMAGIRSSHGFPTASARTS